MKINFRQGIISHQQMPFLQFVGGDTVDILADTRPVSVSIAHRGTNYTHAEDNTVNAAWSGITATNTWLYWDFNPLTFNRTFGHTDIEPISQPIAPGAGNAPIINVTPAMGSPAMGEFTIAGQYVLPIGRTFNVINSTGSPNNDGLYTVRTVTYDMITAETTIGVNEPVPSSVIDGVLSFTTDSFNIPLDIEGRHWYDTATNIHYVRQSGNWVEVIRVFAARVSLAGVFTSVSIGSAANVFTGTQIGNNTPVFSGRPMFFEALLPITRDDGTFVTTEDQFFTNQSRVDGVRLESNIARAKAATPLSEYNVVSWISDGVIASATYDEVGDRVIGIITEDTLTNQVGAVVIQGVVTNPITWDWTGAGGLQVGNPLWVDNGMLVGIDPFISAPLLHPEQRVPVARVLSADTVIFEQGLGGVGPQGPPGSITGFPPATTSVLGGVTLVTPSSDALQALVISDTDPRLADARAPLPHTHPSTAISFIPGGGLTSLNVQDALLELTTLAVPSTLDGLIDVTVPAPNDSDVLSWDSGTNMWISSPPSGGGGTITNYSESFIATAGQTVFTLSTPYTMGENAIHLYLEGVHQALTLDYIETSPTTVTLLTGAVVGSRVLIEYSVLSGGFSPTGMLNDLIDVSVSAPNDNDVLSWDSGTNMWQTMSLTPSPASTNYSESFIATAGQTVFNLSNSYIVGTNSVHVYRSGVHQAPVIDYIETSPTSITLLTPAPIGTRILIEHNISNAILISASTANWSQGNNGTNFTTGATASGANSYSAGPNTLSAAPNSLTFGNNTANLHSGLIIHAIGSADNSGDRATGHYYLRGESNSTSPFVLRWGENTTNNPINEMTFDADSVYMFTAKIVGMARTDSTLNASYILQGTLRGNSMILGTTIKTVLYESNVGMDAEIFDPGAGAIQVRVTAPAGGITMQWFCDFEYQKVTAF